MAAAAAAPPPPNFPPFTPPPSKSDSNALFKSLIIVFLLLAIPLFPSQAPAFIPPTVFAGFWEIIHLLFIGIAVSYGLFARRASQFVPDKSATDSYLSGISHISSIFDHGYENENDMLLDNYANCGDYQFLGNDDCVVVPSGVKIGSLLRDGEDEGGGDRAWHSHYTKGESLVVVSNAKCFVGGSSDFKPLNLPIRSLRSRAMDSTDSDEKEFKNGNEFSCNKYEAKGNDDSNDDDDARAVVKIRGVVPVNLDKRFEEVAGRSTSPIWCSRSGRVEDEEDVSKLPAHNRPHSVGEFEFEHLKSRRPLRGCKFSSTPELRSSKVENLERERVFAAAHSKADSIDSDPFSNSASSDMDSVGDLENSLESSSVEEEVRKGKQAIESLESDVKSSPLSKVPARAKSVRTIKPKRYEHCPNRGEGRVGRRFIKSQAVDSLVKGREEPEILPDRQNQEYGRIFSMPKPKPTLPEVQSEEKHDVDDLSSTKSVDGEIGFDKTSAKDETRPSIDTDGELGSEVDRKADEFIAKFREQIRRQKASTSSVEGHSGW
ncbi:uncharacterized protein LOC125219656 [Salvia hispanica]|uniref:uncharacterized protein LOC125219656 n=1 Tax=Salvia hispanica TaxID=49212 RepID=UPI0020094813|nr:uncharacterized protein LOC125219656 [Salvia hispanica]